MRRFSSTMRWNSTALGVVALSLAAFCGSSVPAHANLTIIPTWDSSILNDPNASTIMSTINSAINVYQTTYADNITVNIKFQEGGGLGSSATFVGTVAYSDYVAALQAHATTADDALALSTLPGGATNPVNGSTTIAIKTANARALGFSGFGVPLDSTITLNTSIMNLTRNSIDPAKYDLLAVTEHEMNEALASGSALDGLNNGDPAPTGAVSGLDLYRYDQNGNRSFNTTEANEAYFSIDGGATDLARFNQTGGGDFGDYYSAFGGNTPQVQDAFSTPGATPNMHTELRTLDVLGYSRIASAAPEPGTLALLLPFALSGGVVLRRRKK